MNTRLQSLTDTADEALARARSGIDTVAADARDLTRRGASAVRDGTQQLRAQSAHLADATAGYIRHEPMKAVLVAAAAGALLMALASLASRSHRD